MLKKISNTLLLLFTSGILFHRSTVIGVLCALWVYSGAQADESVFSRALTPDLYLFMASFLIFYRLLFKRILKKDGNFDWTAMLIYTLGDLAWATAVMFFAVPAFMMTNYSGQEYAERVQKAAKIRAMMH